MSTRIFSMESPLKNWWMADRSVSEGLAWRLTCSIEFFILYKV